VIPSARLRGWIETLAKPRAEWSASGTELLDALRELLARRQNGERQVTAGWRRSAEVWAEMAAAARQREQALLDRLPTQEQANEWTLDALSCLPAVDDVDPEAADRLAGLIDRASAWLSAD
jgi:hypothetical protein